MKNTFNFTKERNKEKVINVLLLGEELVGKSTFKDFAEKTEEGRNILIHEMSGIDIYRKTPAGISMCDKIVDKCAECDIVIVLINNRGLEQQSEELLEELIDTYPDKQFLFIYRSIQSRVKYLKNDSGLKYVVNECEAYKRYIEETGSFYHLEELLGYKYANNLCVIPHSEELTTTLDKEDMNCTNAVLSDYIGRIMKELSNMLRSKKYRDKTM